MPSSPVVEVVTGPAPVVEIVVSPTPPRAIEIVEQAGAPGPPGADGEAGTSFRPLLIASSRADPEDEEVAVWIVDSDGTGWWRVSPDGGSVFDNATSPSWDSSDPKRAVYGVNKLVGDAFMAGLVVQDDVYDPSTANVILPLTTYGTATQVFHPDGSLIAFCAYNEETYSRTDLWTIKPDGTELTKILDGGVSGKPHGCAWQRDGSKLWVNLRHPDAPLVQGIYTCNSDGSDLTLILQDETPPIPPPGIYSIAVSDNLIAVSAGNPSGGPFNLFTFKPDGTDIQQITSHTAGNYIDIFGTFTLDGRRIYANEYLSTDDSWHIVTMDVNGGNRRRWEIGGIYNVDALQTLSSEAENTYIDLAGAADGDVLVVDSPGVVGTVPASSIGGSGGSVFTTDVVARDGSASEMLIGDVDGNPGLQVASTGIFIRQGLPPGLYSEYPNGSLFSNTLLACYGAEIYGRLEVDEGISLNSDTAPGNGITFGDDGDTNLYRSAADTLQTDDLFRIHRTSGQDALNIFRSGDTFPRFAVKEDGTLEWGPGSGVKDVSLFRADATKIGVDSLFSASFRAGSVQVSMGDFGPSGAGLLFYNDTLFMRTAPGVLTLTDKLVIGPNPGPTFPTMTGPGLLISNLTAAPSTNPTGGVFIYSEAGVLKSRNPSGTVTTIAPAAGGGSSVFATDVVARSGAGTETLIGDVGGGKSGLLLAGGVKAYRSNYGLNFNSDVFVDSGASLHVDYGGSGWTRLGFGSLYFGSGGLDTGLYRAAADILQTDDLFRIVRLTGEYGLNVMRSGDTYPRFAVKEDGMLEWGPGSGAANRNLYPHGFGGNALGTDSRFMAPCVDVGFGGNARTVVGGNQFPGISLHPDVGGIDIYRPWESPFPANYCCISGPLRIGTGASAPTATGVSLTLSNVSAGPSTNPAGGGVVYCEAGALKYRGSSGTITTLGVA